MKSLVVLESRRARRESAGPSPVEGSQQFGSLVESLLRDLKNQGTLPTELNVPATRAALVGMVEGLLLEEVLSAREGRQGLYGPDEARRVIESFVFSMTTEPVSPQTRHDATSWTHVG